MSSPTENSARLNFRLPAELKEVIEQAAVSTGQTVSDFAVSTLVREARDIIEESDRTTLTHRDRDLFVALLDDPLAKPNEALLAAAHRYKKRRG